MKEYSKELADAIATLVNELDDSYSFDTEHGVFTLRIEYEDISYLIHIYVYEERILFDTILPFRCPEEKKYEFSYLKAFLDYRIIMGALNYDYHDGEVGFETHLFCGNDLPSQDTIRIHLLAGCVILGDYLDSIVKVLFSGEKASEVIKAME